MSKDASSVSSQKPVRLKCLVLGSAGAGKTSLLRRYFQQRFDAERTPTVGADFYTRRVYPHVTLQCWDTPGSERMDPRKPTADSSAATFRQEFFRQADAVLLVYDVTSSTSFKQLLKWYADLLQLEQKLPILVLGNKLDLTVQGGASPSRRRVPSIHQRDVMGLRGHFRGHDFRYEYHVTPPTKASSLSSQVPKQTLSQFTQGNLKKLPKRRMEISSYLVNRENWTDDWSYLASVLNSEDQSNPDRDMVLLWCRRNGLQHCEASAATGEGVSEVMEALIQIALAHAKSEHLQPEQLQQPTTHVQKTIDFQTRYAAKEKTCCLCIRRPIPNLLVLTRRDSL
ncbi:hypothetical protein FisN_4Lh276 [Fistulifera solaris]|uniref:Uncharacterized protein n=1 Tax=Fistulifera solaris TaxID=1519565 RepID=A0A1Z5KD85_FISSO|nr:hypothetical protein FisN_4Lh276 [Fistulifera solaris]|eukprot:GAX24187.1 hypothetical protein FisN_4Lh276 [Fistulifera solaris]